MFFNLIFLFFGNLFSFVFLFYVIIYYGNKKVSDEISSKYMFKMMEFKFFIVIIFYEIVLSDAMSYLSYFKSKYFVVDDVYYNFVNFYNFSVFNYYYYYLFIFMDFMNWYFFYL